MQLNLNDDDHFEDPTLAMVLDGVMSLAIDAFAILSRKEEDYIQTYHNEDGSYDVEFRAGSYDKHFRAANELTVNEVATAFAAYFEGQAGWQDPWEWEVVEFDEDFEGDLTYDNAYELNGVGYRKIPVGEELSPIPLLSQACPECRARVGGYHERGCELEECPCCREPIHGCDCE